MLVMTAQSASMTFTASKRPQTHLQDHQVQRLMLQASQDGQVVNSK